MYLRPSATKRKNKLRAVWLALVCAYLAVATLVLRENGAGKPIASLAPADTPTPAASMEQRLAAGDVYFNTGKLLLAEEAYQRAVTLAPNNDLALAKYALVLAYRRKYDDAIAIARRALLADPRSAKNYAVLCLALDWAGKYDDALAAGQQALNLDPNLLDAYAYLAEANADLNRTERVLPMLDHGGEGFGGHRRAADAAR